ncbi:hypothetical protein C7477_1165 [Phyllobacterium leguminum]|uniref:Uncharacterized protein n=1 Tax=Phyllobacterium leguminum TaxID=314237 RepID=A0A318T0F6_9HYPH|nr:hypothetical protein C7477_1165 [Phyllobacterium leguminum]
MHEANDRGLKDVLIWLSYAGLFVVVCLVVNELRGLLA